MDFRWLEGFSEEIESCIKGKSSFDSHDYKLVQKKYLREFWEKENPNVTQLYPRTLVDAQEYIDALVVSTVDFTSIVHVSHLHIWQIERIYRLFYSAIVHHMGDRERCAAFVLRYQSIASFLIVKDVVSSIVSREALQGADGVTMDCLRIFYPEIHENEEELAKLAQIMQCDFLMKGFTQWAACFLTGVSTSLFDNSQVISRQQYKPEIPEDTQMFVKRAAYFPGYSTTERIFKTTLSGSSENFAATNYKSCFYAPSNDLYYFYLNFLALGLRENIKLQSNRHCEVNKERVSLMRQCYYTRIFSGCDEWRKAYDEYIAWEPEEQTKSVFVAVLGEKNAFSISMGKRSNYEKQLRKRFSDTGKWIEYIMWELDTSYKLYQELHSKGLCSESIHTFLIRPIALCERAVTNVTYFNFGKELLCTILNSPPDTQTDDSHALHAKLTVSWNACGSTLKKLFVNDRLTAEAFRPSFREKDNSSAICHLTSCLPIWIQYVAVFRLLLMRMNRGCVESAFKNSQMFRYVIPSLISRAIQSHPESMELLSECVFLAYYYEEQCVKYGWPLESAAFPSTAPASITTALMNSKILSMLLSNLIPKNEDEISAPGSVNPPTVLAFLSKSEMMRKPLYQMQHNLIVLFYLLGTQAKFGSFSVAFVDGLDSNGTTTPSFRVGLPGYIANTLQALRKVINIQNEFCAAAKTKKIEAHEIFDTFKLFILAIQFALQKLRLSEYPCTTLNLKRIAKEFTQIIEVPLHGYDKSSYLDILDVLYQTYDKKSDELGEVYNKLVIQKAHGTSKAYKKLRPNAGSCSELLNQSSEFTTFFNTALSLFCTIEKRMRWEAMRYFRCSKNSVAQQEASSNDTNSAQTWQEVMSGGMKNWMQTSDDIRVSLQQVDMDFWVSSLGDFFFQIDLPATMTGTSYVCVRNLPAPLEEPPALDSPCYVENDVMANLKSWLMPFSPADVPLILFQKKQAIALIKFSSSSEALQCATSKNRSAWNTEEKVRTISVLHVKSVDELKKLQESFDGKKRRLSETKKPYGQKRRKPEVIGKDDHKAKSNAFFATLFSKGK